MSNAVRRLAIRFSAIAHLLAVASLATIVGPSPASAQHKSVLQGVVADQITGELLDSATVTLVGTGISGKTTDGGIFFFSDVPLGKVSIRAQADGYPTVTEEVEITPGVLIMQISLLSTHAILDGFLVTGRAPHINASEDARSAADLLLRQIPGIATKRGVVGQNDSQILLRGVNSINLSSEPMLFLDGVRMKGGLGQAMDVLSHVPASDVKEIRVLRGVSAAFLEGSPNGVIYVETKSGSERR